MINKAQKTFIGISALAACIFVQSISASDIKDIKIPARFGKIDSFRQGSKDAPSIIFIQDIHTSIGAQKNLSRIIEYLNKNYGYSQIFLEGASGKISTCEISIFPDKKVKQDVAEYFLQNGNIDGTEYLSIIENNGLKTDVYSLYGVENSQLYKQNLNSYQCSVSSQDEIKRVIELLKESARCLKEKIYSKRLFGFDEKVNSFYLNQDNFLEFVMELSVYAGTCAIDTDSYPNFKSLIAVNKIESSVDFARVDAESSMAVHDTASKLSSKEEAEKLYKKEFDFKIQKIPAHEYFSYLNTLMEKNNVSADRYPAVKQYIRYLNEYNMINQAKVIEECRELEKKIYGSLITDEPEKKLHDVSCYISMLEKFSNLQVSGKNLELYEEYKNKITLDEAVIFLKEQSLKYGLRFDSGFSINTLKVTLANLEEFYRIARERETHMVSNIIGQLKLKGFKQAVFVAGGFHCDGIVRLLEENGISNMVIVPDTGDNKKTIPYLSLLEGYKTPFDQLIGSQISTLKIASWFSADSLADNENNSIMIAKMKTLLATTKLYDMYHAQLEKFTSAEDVIVMKKYLETKLKDAIDDILIRTAYDKTLKVQSIEINPYDIVAQISFVKKDDELSEPVFVSCSHMYQGNNGVPEIAQNLLEVINMSSGLQSSFFDYAGYIKLKLMEQVTKARIIKVVSQSPSTPREIVKILNDDKSELPVKLLDVQHYTRAFMDAGLLNYSLADGKYSISGDFASKVTETIMSRFYENYKRNPNLDSSETMIIDIDELPADLRKSYPNIDTQLSGIAVDPAIHIEAIYSAAKMLFENAKTTDSIMAALKNINRTRFVEVSSVYTAVDPRPILYIVNTPSTKLNPKPQPSIEEKFMFPGQKVYFAEQKEHSLKETENDLWILVKLGDSEAETKLLNTHKGLAMLVVNRFKHVALNSPHYDKYLNIDDLVSIANEGLLKAIRTFDPSRGFKFSTYGYTVIHNELRRHFNASSWISQGVRQQIAVMRNAEKELSNLNGFAPSETQLADYMNTSIQKIQQLKQFANQEYMASLDESFGDDEDGRSLLDIIGDQSAQSPYEAVEDSDLQNIFKQALGFLTDREREILTLKFSQQKKTSELADMYGVTRSMIGQIENKAVEKLKILIRLLTQSGDKEIKNLEQTVFSVVDKLPPQDREIMLLAYGDSMDWDTIEKLFGFQSHSVFLAKRNQIINSVKEQVEKTITDPLVRNIIDQKVIKWDSLFSSSLDGRQEYMIEILQDLVTRSVNENIDTRSMNRIFADYRDFLTPREQEMLILHHYEGYNFKEIGSIFNISAREANRIFLNLQKRLANIINVRLTLSEDTRKDLAETAVKILNSMPLLTRRIMIDLYFEGKHDTQIARNYNVEHHIVLSREKSVVFKLRKKFEKQLLAVLPEELHVIMQADKWFLFKEFMEGLFFDIQRDMISTAETQVSKDIDAILEYTASEVLNLSIDNDKAFRAITQYAKLIDLSDRNILTLRYSDGLDLNAIAEQTGLSHNQLQNRFHQHIFSDLRYFIDIYQKLSDSEIAELENLPVKNTDQFRKAREIQSDIIENSRAILEKNLLKYINFLPLKDRDILINLFVEANSSDDIAQQMGLKRYNVTNAKLRVLDSLRNDMAPHMREYKHITDDIDKFEDFMRGLILFIPKEKFSKRDLTEPQNMVEALELIAVQKLKFASNRDTLERIINLIEPFIDPFNRNIINFYFIQGYNLTQTGEMIGKDYYFVQRYLKKNIYPAVAELIDMAKSLTPEQLEYVNQIRFANIEQFKDTVNVLKIVPDQQRNKIAEISIVKINNTLLRNRKILISYLVDRLTVKEIASKYSIPSHIAEDHINNVISAFQKDMAPDLIELNDSFAKYTSIENKNNFSGFISGCLAGHDKTAFSDEQINLPESVKDILAVIAFEKFDFKIDPATLNEILTDFEQGLDSQTKHMLMMQYQEMLFIPEIAEKIGRNEDFVENILNESVYKPLKDILEFYSVFDRKTLMELRSILAESIKEWSGDSKRERHNKIIIYFAYDLLDYDQIGRILCISTKHDHHIHQVYMAISSLQNHFIKKIESDNLKQVFEGNIRNFKFLLRGLRHQFAREEFHVQGVPADLANWAVSKKDVSSIRKDNLYNEELLAHLFDYFGIENPSLQDKSELSAVMDLLNEKQVEALELRYLKKLRAQDIAHLQQIAEKSVNQNITRAMEKIGSYYDFLSKFLPADRSLLRHLAAQTIDSFPKENREIFVHSYYDAMDNKQIAGLLNLSIHAGTSGISKMKTRLHERFLDKLSDPQWKTVFSSPDYFEFLMYSLKAEIARERFNVPVPFYKKRTFVNTVLEEVTGLVPEGCMIADSRDKYPVSFLYRLWMNLNINDSPTELELSELRAVLSILGEQELRSLEFMHLDPKFSAKMLNMKEQEIKSILETSFKKLGDALIGFQQFAEPDRAAIRVVLAGLIQDVDIRNIRRKQILTYCFNDGLSDERVVSLIRFDRPDKTMQRFRAEKKRALEYLQAEIGKLKRNIAQKDKLVSDLSLVESFARTMRSSVPRNYFDIAVDTSMVQPVLTDNMDSARSSASPVPLNIAVDEEDTVSQVYDAKTQSEPVRQFTDKEVQELFKNFNYDTVDQMRQYLKAFESDNNIALPHPLIINRNLALSDFRRATGSLSGMINRLPKSHKIKMKPWEIAQLRYVLETAGFIQIPVSRSDVIVLDLDTVGIPLKTPYSNVLFRQQFSQYIREFLYQYRHNNRDAKFVFFSKKMNSVAIENLLGSELFSEFKTRGNRIYSKEIFKLFGDGDNSDRFKNMVTSLLVDYGINSINMKIHTQDTGLIGAGKSMGAIFASRECSLFDALAVFAAIHPDSSSDLPVYRTFSRIRNLVGVRNRGYLSLAGLELSNPNKKKTRNIFLFSQYLDSSL